MATRKKAMCCAGTMVRYAEMTLVQSLQCGRLCVKKSALFCPTAVLGIERKAMNAQRRKEIEEVLNELADLRSRVDAIHGEEQDAYDPISSASLGVQAGV